MRGATVILNKECVVLNILLVISTAWICNYEKLLKRVSNILVLTKYAYMKKAKGEFWKKLFLNLMVWIFFFQEKTRPGK